MPASTNDPSPALRFTRADDIAPEALHAAFLSAFSDYLIGPFQVPLAQWPMFLARQGVELALSRVAVDGGGVPLAFAFVAPRPVAGRWRLATMGATPSARGTGAAPALLDDFIARAAAAGQRAVELEVFAQNERARRLYEGRGFAVVHPLHGFLAEPGTIAPAVVPAEAAPGAPQNAQGSTQRSAPQNAPLDAARGIAPRAVDLPTALAWLDAAERRLPDLPLQVTAATVRLGVDYHAWQAGPIDADGDGLADGARAQVVFSLPDETVMIHSLIAPRDDDARALLQALVAVHPERKLRVPQLQREDLGGAALRALGALAQPLHQELRVRPL